LSNLKGVKAQGKLLPHSDVVNFVRNCSSRNGRTPNLIVLHSTEGANIKGIRDLQGLGGWFDNPSAQASSHVATDADGNSARYVDDSVKAWHCAGYNSASLGVEQVGKAAQDSWPDKQLLETARWIALWHRKYGIPIRKGKVASDGRVLRSGVVMHSDLGNLGGGHHDPGGDYPLTAVIRVANGFQNLYEARSKKKK
jgi:N-acetyl-anhydromuramyl-L-alanine amidase AmpD